MFTRTTIATTILATCLSAGCATETSEKPASEATPSVLPSSSKNQTCTVSAETGDRKCYSTLTEAIAAVTGGRITDAPADAKTAANDEELAARINALATPTTSKNGDAAVAQQPLQDIPIEDSYANILAIFYQDCDYSGNAMVVWGAHTCSHTTDDVDYYVWWVGSANNDTLSSFRGYSNCWASLCVDADLGGGCTLYRGSWGCFYDGYNDEISSFTLS